MTIRNTENIPRSTDLTIQVVVQPEDLQGMTTARQTRTDDQDTRRLNEYLTNLSLQDTESEMGTLTATAPTTLSASRHPFHTSASLQRLQTSAFRFPKNDTSASRPISRNVPQLQGSDSLFSAIGTTLTQSHRQSSASPLTPTLPHTPVLQRVQPQPLPPPTPQSTLASLLSPILYLYSPRSTLSPTTCANLSYTLSLQNLTKQLSTQTFDIIALSTLIASVLLESCAPVRDEEIKRVERETRLQGEERCGGWDEGWVLEVATRWEGIVGACLDVSVPAISITLHPFYIRNAQRAMI